MAFDTSPPSPSGVIDCADLMVRARRLGLSSRIEPGPDGQSVRLLGPAGAIVVGDDPSLPLLDLAEIGHGSDAVSLPDPSDVSAARLLSYLGTEATVLAFPSAGRHGPIDSVVPTAGSERKRAGGQQWTKHVVQVSQGRLWLTWLQSQVPAGVDVVSMLSGKTGLTLCQDQCSDSAIVSEYMTDLGWPYLAFPNVSLWQVEKTGNSIALWAASTPASVTALLLASLIQLDTPGQSPDENLAAAISDMRPA